MKKHYGYTNRTAIKISCILGLAVACTGGFQLCREEYVIGIFELIAGIVFFIYNAYMYGKISNAIGEFIDIVADDKAKDDYTTDVFQFFPLPMAIMHIDGNIIWYNNEFSDIVGKESFAGQSISDIMPSVKWGYILKSKGPVSTEITFQDKVFNICGRIVCKTDSKDNKNYLVYLFLVDKTAETNIRKLYNDEKTDVTIISIDNYEYITQKLDDSNSQNVLYNVNKLLNDWIKQSGGVLKKTDRDRYLAMFEHKYLNNYIDSKFDILENIRKIGEGAQLPMSISMGTGTGGNISENEQNARNALDMAIGRGGDQSVIKDETQYRFFGAKNNEYEKSNRLKTRAVARALKGFIDGVDKVVLVGHKNIDYDCFGSAMGMQRIIRNMGKKPYIVVDSVTAIKKLYDNIANCDEYSGMFVDENSVLDIIDRDTLLIVLDTSRNSLLPSSHLLSRTEKIIVIDHHRRPTDYISPCSLIYNEPFASSVCEMVTEIIQYIDNGANITPLETQSLYMGILMDTKNFLLKTGVRTFEAASYLKRLGLDTVAVKKMFGIDKSEYIIKTEIVETLEHITDTITMSVCSHEYENIRTIASQAADDMLCVDNSQCSFVLYPYERGIGVSGRSYGDINVQLILEQLGGGGHQTVAGAQLHTADMEYAKELLRKAVSAYNSERG